MSTANRPSSTLPCLTLLQDQPLLKVPYELARKNFKASQRHVEHEQKQFMASIKSASTTAALSSDPAATLSSIDSMIAKIETLKRKLETLHSEEQTIHKHARARISHLAELHTIPSLADVKHDEWAKVRLNRLLVDYLFRRGYGESAQARATETGVEHLVDIDAFLQCHQINASLEQQRTAECLAWCSDSKQTLKKMNASSLSLPDIVFKVPPLI